MTGGLQSDPTECIAYQDQGWHLQTVSFRRAHSGQCHLHYRFNPGKSLKVLSAPRIISIPSPWVPKYKSKMVRGQEILAAVSPESHKSSSQRLFSFLAFRRFISSSSRLISSKSSCIPSRKLSKKILGVLFQYHERLTFCKRQNRNFHWSSWTMLIHCEHLQAFQAAACMSQGTLQIIHMK